MKVLVFGFLIFCLIQIISAEDGCPDNQVYDECGSACPATCNQGTIVCTMQCVPGCFCKEGYARRSETDHTCVPLSECPRPKCTKRQYYTECGTTCPEYCGSETPTICPKNCVKGCFCKPGYVQKSSINKKCIRPKTCPVLLEIETE